VRILKEVIGLSILLEGNRANPRTFLRNSIEKTNPRRIVMNAGSDNG
jgi:hypothetical protein